MKRNQRGRPTVRAKGGKKHTVSLRLTGELKNRLDAASKKNDRSLSQEGELRLEQSFRTDRLLNDALALRYGPRLAGILRTIGEVMDNASRLHGLDVTQSFIQLGPNWLDSPIAFQVAREAAVEALASLGPNGTAELSDAAKAEALKIGQLHEGYFAMVLGKDNPGQDIVEIREMLGPDMVRSFITGE